MGARAAEQLIREGAAAILAEAQRPAAARADRA
jgi:hypothetical protein